MEILSPAKVKESKGLHEKFASERIRRLSNEETRLVKNIGVLRVEYQRQMRITELATDDAKLAVKKSVLAREVEALEQRKSDAMIPLQKKHDELKEKELDIIAQRNSLQIESEQNITEKQNLAIVKSTLEERERKIIDTEKSLDRRQTNIQASEQQITVSTEELARGWIDLNNEKLLIEEERKKLAEKQTTLSMKEKALDIQKDEQEKRSRDLDERERGINYRYSILSQSEKEVKSRTI